MTTYEKTILKVLLLSHQQVFKWLWLQNIKNNFGIKQAFFSLNLQVKKRLGLL